MSAEIFFDNGSIIISSESIVKMSAVRSFLTVTGFAQKKYPLSDITRWRQVAPPEYPHLLHFYFYTRGFFGENSELLCIIHLTRPYLEIKGQPEDYRNGEEGKQFHDAIVNALNKALAQ